MEPTGTEKPVAPTLGHGRYVMGRELGRGSMGVVYEAEDTVLGRTVAVKTIELAFAPGEQARKEFEQRFFTEARVAARLSHPGIVVCHDTGKDPVSGKLFIVFEYLKGRTLAARAAEGQMPWREALAVMLQAARAIHHAHEHGVVHRDLKPANIMLLDAPKGAAPAVRGDVAVKIMDFGVARLESLSTRLTGPGQSFGSPLYSSPEQVLGENSSARSDIFSLGSVLCTLLLGRPWFDAPSIPEIVARVVHAESPRVSSLRRELPAVLNAVVATAMAKREEDRYATAADLADDLDDVLANTVPRHAAAVGRSSPRPRVTEDPLLDGLVMPVDGRSLGPVGEASGPLASLLDDATMSLPRPKEAAAAEPAAAPPRRWTMPLAGAAVGVVLLGLGVGFWWTRSAAPAPPSEPAVAASIEAPGPSLLPPPQTLSPAIFGIEVSPSPPATQETPAVAPSAAVAARPTPRATPVVAEPSPLESPAPVEVASIPPLPTGPPTRMRFDVEHPFENGRLIVWIDGVLAFEEKLRAPVARKIVAIKMREGHIEKLVDVEPGKHEVRVEVTWDQERRVATKVADTAAGATGLLEVRVGRLSKDLNLKWSRLTKD